MENIFILCKIDPYDLDLTQETCTSALEKKIDELNNSNIDVDSTTRKMIKSKIDECRRIQNIINSGDYGKFINEQRQEAKKTFLDDVRSHLDDHSVIDPNGKVYISDAGMTALIENLKPSWDIKSDFFKDALDDLKVNIQTDQSTLKSIYRKLKDYKGSIPNWMTFVKSLPMFGSTNLKDVDDSSSFVDVKENYDAIRKTLTKTGNVDNYDKENGAAVQDQCDAISFIFENEYLYEQYKNYVAVKNKAVSDQYEGIREILDSNSKNLRNKVISAEVRDRIQAAFGPGKMAIAVTYCLEKGYAADFTDNGVPDLICPKCDELIKDDGTLLKCTECGYIIFRKCDKCGKKSLSKYDKCTCGHSLVGLSERLDEFDFQMDEGNLVTAEIIIKEIGKDYPDENLESRLDRLNIAKEKVPHIESKIKELYEEHKYYSLIEEFGELQRICPDYKAMDKYVNPARQFKEDAEKSIALGNESEGEESIRHFIDAYDKCKDHPGIKGKKPKEPSSVNLQRIANGVLITIVPSDDTIGVSYTVVRGDNKIPRQIGEGTVLPLKPNSLTVGDTGVQPGNEYCYAVFANRFEVSSEPCHSDVIRILNPPREVKVSQRSGGIEVSFRVPHGAKGVIVIRKEGSYPANLDDGVVIYDGGVIESVWDPHYREMLNADLYTTHYFYAVCVWYSLVNYQERQYSELVQSERFSLVHIPNPITDLNITSEDNPFKASWTGPDCSLYDSDKQITLKDRVLTEKEFSKLGLIALPKCTSKGSNSKEFQLDDDRVHYIYPVIAMGDYWVIGNPCKKSMLPGVMFNVHPEGARCIINLVKWPGESCIEVKATVYYDGNIVKYTASQKERYRQERQIVVDTGNLARYEVGLIAYYPDAGESNESKKTVNTINPKRICFTVTQNLFKKYILAIYSENSEEIIGPFKLRGSLGGDPNEYSDIMLEVQGTANRIKPKGTTYQISKKGDPYMRWGIFFDRIEDKDKYVPIFYTD